MWGLIVDNVITDIIPNPKSVTINNVQYPSNIFSWSKSDLGNLGIYEIVQDNTNLKDSKYYTNTSISYEFKSSVTIDSQSYSNVIVGSYGSATALPMNDILFVDGDEIPKGKKVGDVKEASVIDPQGIDQSKLVPLLVKTIQELEARITSLENA